MRYYQKKIIIFLILLVSLLLISYSSLAMIPGDFGSADNGSPDGVIDFEDLMIFSLVYGTTPSDSNWNEYCDIASEGGVLEPDGVIDFEDLMIFALHYGEEDSSGGSDPVAPCVELIATAGPCDAPCACGFEVLISGDSNACDELM